MPIVTYRIATAMALLLTVLPVLSQASTAFGAFVPAATRGGANAAEQFNAPMRWGHCWGEPRRRSIPIWSKNDSDDEREEDNVSLDGTVDGLVTREMFLQDMLEDPKVKRKKKNGSYRTMDNRDSLPFVVRVKTPDPYTSPEEMKKQARKNTMREKEKKKKKNGGGGSSKNKGGPVRRNNLIGMGGKARDGIAASIYARQNDGSLDKVLGEFHLDKATNCGDLIEVGDREFEVQTARCQYKYAGGKRFVMVRKILEVKEVVRIAEENYLKRQFNREDSSPSPPNLD